MSEANGGEVSPTFAAQATGGTPRAAPEVFTETSMDHIPEAGEGMSARQANAIQNEQDQSQETGEERLYAGKYKSVEELEKAKVEADRFISEGRHQTSSMGLDEMLTTAQVDGKEVFQNFVQDGKLTDAQYSQFAKIGFSKEIADTFLKGQVAIAQNGEYAQSQMRTNAENMAGGPEQFEGLMTWASQNLADERVDQLNGRLAKPDQYEGAIKELMWDYKQNSGRGFAEPLVQGQSMPNTSSGYNNVDEFLGAMTKLRQQGYVDETTKRRIANTPAHIQQGIDR